MKAKTLIKRLEKLNLDRDSRVYKAIRCLASLKITQEISVNDITYYKDTKNNIIIRPSIIKGFLNLIVIDESTDFCQAFDKMNIKYIKGNDSPCGDIEGNFIKLLTKIYF